MGHMTPPKPLRRSEILGMGYSDAMIRRAVRTGELERLSPGVYLAASEAVDLDEVERHRLRVATAAASLHAGTVVSHVSAAALHGFTLLSPDLGCVHVTRAGTGGGRRTAGRYLHVGALGPEDIVDLDGVPCTSAVRTVVDLACTLSPEQAIVAGDSALAVNPCLVNEIPKVLKGLGRRRGLPAARGVLRFLDGGSESPGESLSRLRMHLHGIPAPTLQERLFTPGGEFVARVDFFWREPGIVGEFDGMGKYDVGGRESVRREKHREDALRDLGFEVVRWTWADLDRFDVVVARFMRAVERSRR